MSSYTSTEIKSGVLVTASVALLFALTFIVGSYLGGETHLWQVRFSYVNGLEINAPVYYGGTEVGKIQKIEILTGDEKPLLVTARVSAQVRLREDTQAYIDTMGLMGEKFLELTPGSKSSPFLKTGTVMEGVDPIPFHVLIRKVNLLADRLDVLTESLNPLINRLDGLTGEYQEEIAKIIGNLHETSANVRDMTHDLKYRPWRLVRKG